MSKKSAKLAKQAAIDAEKDAVKNARLIYAADVGWFHCGAPRNTLMVTSGWRVCWLAASRKSRPGLSTKPPISVRTSAASRRHRRTL
jgi:hypothetical protein